MRKPVPTAQFLAGTGSIGLLPAVEQVQKRKDLTEENTGSGSGSIGLVFAIFTPRPRTAPKMALSLSLLARRLQTKLTFHFPFYFLSGVQEDATLSLVWPRTLPLFRSGGQFRYLVIYESPDRSKFVTTIVGKSA